MDSAQDDKETILATSSESEDGIRNRHTDTKKNRNTSKLSILKKLFKFNRKKK